MYNTAVIVVLFAAVLGSLTIIIGNFFIVFVFWKHRNRLKRTSFLLINLAVVDVLVGFIALMLFGAFDSPGHFEEESFNSAKITNISGVFQITFSFTLVFFLTLISLERAYALIWPLRHRVASSTSYFFSAVFAWVAAILGGALTLLIVFDILDLSYGMVGFGCSVVLCLVTICVSYLAIRRKLNCRFPAIDDVHNRQNEQQQKAKLSRTLFLVITASLFFWFPSVIVYRTYYLCFKCVPLLVFHIFNLFRLANSFINPIIYSFKIPIFKAIFKRTKLCKRSEQYAVNYMV